MNKPSLKQTIKGLEYIAESPDKVHGGFHPQAVQIAKDALFFLRRKPEECEHFRKRLNGNKIMAPLFVCGILGAGLPLSCCPCNGFELKEK